MKKVPPFPSWADVRREFLQAENSYCELSVDSVDLVGTLFEAERRARELRTGMTNDEIASTLATRR